MIILDTFCKIFEQIQNNTFGVEIFERFVLGGRRTKALCRIY